MKNNLTTNIMPEEIEVWYFIENAVKKIMELFNFKEFRPSILQANTLYKKYYDFTQELDNKMIEKKVLQLKNLDDFGLRPEGTLAVLNSDIAKQAVDKPQKVFYSGPMFIKNNDTYLQYHQVGAEILGSDNLISDIETVQLAKNIFKELGIDNVVLEINSFGCQKCRPSYLKALKEFIKLNKSLVCKQCQKYINEDPLIILNCINHDCNRLASMAPVTLDYLCNDCLISFTNIKKLLSNLGTSYTINSNLTLNFNYYSGLVFNLLTKNSDKSRYILAKGGRYNQLAKYTTQMPLPAVGFSFNIETVIELVKEKNSLSKKKDRFSVCICSVSDNMELLILQVTQELHHHGIHTVIIEDKIEQEDINELAVNYNAQITLVFREDLIREAKLMIMTYNFHQENTQQDIITLSDITDFVLRKKKYNTL